MTVLFFRILVSYKVKNKHDILVELLLEWLQSVNNLAQTIKNYKHDNNSYCRYLCNFLLHVTGKYI